MEISPKIKGLEEKEYSSKIELHFFRHGEKEKGEGISDEEIRLTPAGRIKAMAKIRPLTISQAVAFGSPRKRTQETAGFAMAGIQPEIIGEETLEELREKIEKDLKVGKKIGVEEKLDFPEDLTTEYHKLTQEHYRKGDLLKFLVEESDDLAKKYNDKKTYTYSRSARQIAELIKKYLKIAPRWNELAEDKSKKYGDTLERFMGTHQTIPESFLAKVIEKTEGKEEKDNFVKLLDNKGFDYVEGFDLEILNTKDGPKIKIHYENKKGLPAPVGKEKPFTFDEYIKPELLDEIIKEGK